MSVPEEYEVETVIQARVFSKRKDKINWKYFVKWKGYEIEDATWEPPSSFNGGSEQLLTRFWERVGDGRDMNDPSLFKTGEEVLPKGPPRKSKNKKVTEAQNEAGSVPALTAGILEANDETDKETKKSGKRRRSPEENVPLKRMRGHPLKTDSKSGLKPKGRSLPHTNGDDIGRPRQGSSPGPSTKIISNALGGTSDDEIIHVSPSEVDVFSRHDNTPLDDVGDLQTDGETDQDDSEDPLFDLHKTDRPSSQHRSTSINGRFAFLPSHRARAANPLVKMVDEPGLGMDGAIAAKARLTGQQVAATSNIETTSNVDPSRSPAFKAPKPTPSRSSQGLQTKNRSSLLVFQKGSLQTRKGKYGVPETNSGNVDISHNQSNQQHKNGGEDDNMEVDGSSDKIPTGQELLQMAGLNEADAEALPDFEDDNPEVAPTSKETSAQSSLAKAARNLFPAESSSSLFSSFNTPWKRSTIFDSLGYGTSAVVTSPQNAALTLAPVATHPAFSLTLDSSVTVSINLKDIYQVTGSPSLDVVVVANPKGPPGKFYRKGVASTLLGTLRSGGSSARIEIGEANDEEHKQHFERFRARLEGGELFVGLAGHEVLAFWSSGNADVGQKLGAPEMLVGLSGTVAVSRVVIQNHSAYADVACQAEHVRW